ncbi:MAG: AarF/ABC1/UbiB kinase family protein [Spirochaetales bacterium]|nr:AarF/ABC1/UbiB kinase family protein [Spirochaetales bacterium]
MADDLISSHAGRALRIGGILAVAGTTFLRDSIRTLTGRDPLSWAGAGERIAETLGRLKGGAMKIGQMLSVQSDFLPPELADALAVLQNSAPPVDFSLIQAQIEKGPGLAVFARIDPEPYRAASIGQVHRATLLDRREVIVKVQYPDIARIVKTDLENLRFLFRGILSMISAMDFDSVWQEIKARLEEELDYETEIRNAQRFAALYQDHPDIYVPEVFPQFSSREVLTMEYVPGLALEEGIADEDERSRRGRLLFEFLFEGIFHKQTIHADPHPGNFSFQEKLIVYDYGCIKELEADFIAEYRGLLHAALDKDTERIERQLTRIGIRMQDGPIPQAMIESFADLFHKHIKPGVFRLGDDADFMAHVMQLKNQFIKETLSIQFPADLIFLQRALTGHFGNLHRLKPSGAWQDFLRRFLG